jgi:peptidoglycan/LPS O-acetylase OafA/YrhL
MIAANPNGLFYKTVSWHGIKALIGNCVFLSSSSLYGPDVFAKNPHPNCVNGSLWTIPVEFGCYLTVAAIGLFKLFKFRWMALVAFVYLWLLYSKAVVLGLDIVTMDRRFFTYFLAGTCACLYFDKIPLHWSLASIALVLTVAAMFTPFWPVICPLALTYLTFYAGYVRPIGILHWCDKTDLSYGVYLYAFPVQQVIAMNIYGRNPWIMLLLAVPATMAVAWVSWHFVERRFLAMKSAPFFDRDHGGARPAEMATQDAQLRQAF